jgi:hypothetical protein
MITDIDRERHEEVCTETEDNIEGNGVFTKYKVSDSFTSDQTSNEHNDTILHNDS